VSSSSDDFLGALRRATTARIGIGRAGMRYPTRAQLQFKEDLAIARDAVHREVDDAMVERLGLLALRSRATSRRDYLMNPARGRFLDDPSVATLRARAIAGADVQIVTSDGLSCEAFAANVPAMLPLLARRLGDDGVTLGTPLFVRWARVGILDHVGEILRPRAAIVLLGERPGLGISDSLSAYFEHAPGPGRVESDRNVLSNIHRHGIPPTEAALQLAEALMTVLRLGKSGMDVRFDFA
jgi:ethanolamine ammonia-lyase small subunit